MTVPKLFISYCWSDSEHEQWVLDFATELCESGVNVILDKWDLKEGNDAVAFMEKMVTDPDIKKVAIICDEKYALKADGRTGGVGTETQIISKEVYDNQAQEKFVAIVKQKDENGKPYLPTYFKSRIFIDLSEEDKYSENFERLQRWIFDKPLYVKPDIGNKPAFLSESEHISLGTNAALKRCVDAIKNQKSTASGALGEYFNLFTLNLERFRIAKLKIEGEFDDAIVKSIEEFLPYRNEVIQLFINIAQYPSTQDLLQQVHRFFERLIPYMNRPVGITKDQESDYDNFRFIVHELFLYAIAVFLKYDKVKQANYLLDTQYYVFRNSGNNKELMFSFVVFSEGMPSLKFRNQRLKQNRVSIRSDLLNERCVGSGIDFRLLLQADFIAFMRGAIDAKGDYIQWWPETLLYLGNNSLVAFEIFARSSSKAYFDKIKILLSINSLEDLKLVLEKFKTDRHSLPRFGHNSFNPEILLGLENLASRP